MSALSSQTDGELLQAFLASQDNDAFAELVRRHAALVFGVCRRLLHCRHDAEDAFQATFIVLARRAADVHPPEQVGRWLHGVAWRTASRARRPAGRSTRAPLPELVAPPIQPLDDLRAILDEELTRLPELYLAPVLLCDLEGLTYRAAAQQLGVPVATLSNRLTAGRRTLARRLLRRGVDGASAGVLAVVAATNEAVSASLLDATASARVLAGVQSPLADGVMQTMLSTSAGKKLAAVVALLVVALGSVMLLASAAEDKHLKELNGDWTVVTAERSGKQASEDDRTAMKVTIKGNTLTIESGNRKEVATIRVDPTTTPASIDLTPARGKETEAGIYKLEGDQLTICWGAARPGERQQQFTTSEKGGGRLLILQRANSRKP